MPNTIQIRRSSTASATPTAGQLADAELAINTADGRLFTKNAAGAIINLPVTSISGQEITPSGVDTTSLGTAASPAFSFSNDPNTGMYSPTADTLGFSTGGTQRIRVDSAGRVNIGTATSWTSRLLVDNGAMPGAAQTETFQVLDSSTTGSYINIGRFNVNRNNARGSFSLSNSGSGAWQNNVMQFFVHGTTYPDAYYGGNGLGAYGAGDNLGDYGCAMIVTQGSNVRKLQIGNYDNAPIEFFANNIRRMRVTTDDKTQFYFTAGMDVTQGAGLVFVNQYADEFNTTPIGELAAIYSGTGSVATSGYLAFFTGDANAITEKVRIDESGKVGIGLSGNQIDANIEVLNDVGTGLAELARFRRTDATDSATFSIHVDNTAFLTQLRSSGSSPAGFAFYSGTTERMRMLSSGFLGLNTNNPTERLEVVGNAKIDGNLNVTGTITGLPIATTSALGVVKIGSGISVDVDGVISVAGGGGGYTLPNATTSTLGGVIVGTGLGVTSGTVSVTYGTTGGTACQGNDSRLSDARTPTSHVHGNITNAGAIGSTSGQIVVTTTGGVLTTASTIASSAVSGLGGAATLNVGTTAGTVAAGDDSRLSDARTPTSHAHGNITNAGAIGTTADTFVVTGPGGVLTTIGSIPGASVSAGVDGNYISVGDSVMQALDALDTEIANVNGSLATKQKTITSGTAAPSGGVDGDIYLQYT